MSLPIVAEREFVVQRGKRIAGWLSQLVLLYWILLALMTLGLAFVLVGSVLISTEPLVGAATGAVVVLPLVVGLVSLALYIFGLRAARKAVQSVVTYVGNEQRGTLVQDSARLSTWLTAWQWFTVVAVLLSLLISVLSLSLGGSQEGMAAFGWAGVLVSTVISGGMAWVTWRAIDTVKHFFMRVSAHSRGGQAPVMSTASQVASWLQLIWILLWIGVVFLVLGVLGMLAAVLVPLMLNRQGVLGTAGIVLGTLLISLLLMALGVWSYGLFIRVVGHFRLFAPEVAIVLDQKHQPAGTPPPVDPWGDSAGQIS